MTVFLAVIELVAFPFENVHFDEDAILCEGCLGRRIRGIARDTIHRSTTCGSITMNEHLRGVSGVPCMFFVEFLTVAFAFAAISAAVAVARSLVCLTRKILLASD